MKLITKSIGETLKKNYLANQTEDGSVQDFKPALKLFNPCGAATWLITEWDGEDYLFGLCDLGMGCPELGSVSLSEIQALKLPFGLGVERDMHFSPDKTLSQYADDAQLNGRIDA